MSGEGSITQLLRRYNGRLVVQAGRGLSNTVVIFVGDNGTPGQAVAPGFDGHRAKDTLYQGGIRVPLIITGPRSVFARFGRNTTINDPVNTTDIFATISAIVGAGNPAGTDWVSLLPYLDGSATSQVRPYAYAEKFDAGANPHASGGWSAYSDGTYKVMEKLGSLGTLVECYDLSTDPLEATNLWGSPSTRPAQCQTVYDALEAGPHAGLP
jgi:arylsulfatase A-like enzyme